MASGLYAAASGSQMTGSLGMFGIVLSFGAVGYGISDDLWNKTRKHTSNAIAKIKERFQNQRS